MARKYAKLEKLIEEASVDTDSIEDVALGLCYGIQEHVRFPIRAKAMGEEVSVVGVEESDGLEVIVICERKGRKYRARLQDVRLRERPEGAEWIDAYELFRRRGW
jgi:hypothetical protein